MHAGGLSYSPGPGSSVDERAWDDYRDALDAMQRRIDAMGPVFDAYDAPSLREDEGQLTTEQDTEFTIQDCLIHQDPNFGM